jgi:hypothetical protein
MESDQNHNAIRDTAPGREEPDFSLLEDSLRLTPWERFLENEQALAFVRMLETARAKEYGPPESTA